MEYNHNDGSDFANDESLPMDDNGYGTYVAGTIAAEDNGSVDVCFGPKAPADQESNWIQTEDGLPSSVSTAHSNHGLTRPGGRERLSWLNAMEYGMGGKGYNDESNWLPASDGPFLLALSVH